MRSGRHSCAARLDRMLFLEEWHLASGKLDRVHYKGDI